ncbi:MAG: YggS family pyridoxal phosphate-dependent enzyme [Gemmatimonadaceae bacterium]|nr:YggS family pyridoxal phosphate-dependent enzyme [Gemmatimonadaceae bacterium]
MEYPDLGERVAGVRAKISAAASRGGHGQTVTLVAVTKTHGPEAVEAACSIGVLDVGENKIQEATQKMSEVSAPVRWHLIGHLQRNKVKAVDHFTLVHSVDSGRLADAIHRFGMERGRAVDVLVQVNGSREESKGGYSVDDLHSEADRLALLPGIRVCGVMTMGRLDAPERELRESFQAARTARGLLMEAGHPAKELSMGMSQDYEIAVEEGATMVRLGTTLFGAREK